MILLLCSTSNSDVESADLYTGLGNPEQLLITKLSLLLA